MCVCVCVCMEFTCFRHSCTQPPWMSSHQSILLSIFYIRLREWFVSNDFLFATKTTTLYRQITIIQNLWARCDNLRNVLCMLGVNFTVYRAKCEANRNESIWRHKLIQSFHFYLIEIQVWIGNTPLCVCVLIISFV